jgi:hypothetical protein
MRPYRDMATAKRRADGRYPEEKIHQQKEAGGIRMPAKTVMNIMAVAVVSTDKHPVGIRIPLSRRNCPV